jgi:hypothetical protein
MRLPALVQNVAQVGAGILGENIGNFDEAQGGLQPAGNLG